MLIKQDPSHQAVKNGLRSLTFEYKKIGVLLILLGVLVVIVQQNELPKLYKYIKYSSIRGKKINLSHIDIDIKYKEYQKLAYKRYVALKKGILVSAPDDYVPAKIRYKDRIVKAKVRLKGDLVDQLKGDKWPFRIVIKGDDSLFGMKVFSIHQPSARGFIYEWVLHKAMRRENIISLRYDFLDVTINGKRLGIYALEEHFEKRLIEHNRRREGPIVCFNEDVDIAKLAHFGWSAKKRADFYSAPIDVYRPTKTMATPKLRREFMLAKNLLESFRREEKKTCDVFDCEILGKYFALLDLFNARHAAKYGNLKFYFNPITSKLEPICFDAEFVGAKDIYSGAIHAENWHYEVEGPHFSPTHLFFSDNDFFEIYMRELKRFSDPAYFDQLFNDIVHELRDKIDILRIDYPHPQFVKELFYSRQKLIRQVLTFPRSLHAYFIRFIAAEETNQIELNVSSIRSIPIRLLSLCLADKIISAPNDIDVIIPPSIPGRPTVTTKVRFPLPHGFKWDDKFSRQLKVNYQLLGINTIQNEQVIPWADWDEDACHGDTIYMDKDMKSLDFILINEKSKVIYIKNGDWMVTHPCIFPKGYTVICKGNTRLFLSNQGAIISYAPFQFTGSAKQPIIIIREDKQAQGMILINTKNKSVFKYVVFKNLANFKQDGLDITGAVTFFKAPVDITNCRFTDNQSEDALNIIDSEFTISATHFSNTASDAVDVDFGHGSIIDSKFTNCGNDAIDISGSEVEVRNISINGAGDKGLSVGEKSKMKAFQIDIKNANIAAASKDLSELSIDHITISNCKTGLSAYQKKSEFGPGRLNVTHLSIVNTDLPYAIQEKSQLIVDNKHAERTNP